MHEYNVHEGRYIGLRLVVPKVIETHGRLGEAANAEITYLADVASSGDCVDRGAFNRNFKTAERSIEHVKGKALVFQAFFLPDSSDCR